MNRLLFLALAAVTLAACDAPDPASFKHVLRDDSGTGSHIAGVNGGNESSSSDTHSIDRMTRPGSGLGAGGH
ncbi:MAG TPA: hypothetical protein VM689_01835 [Aliidongia sp.]|nr:hypothetical protein [Aliidongia sp.]